eukprot:7313291-Prymnesium_polylepis.1
MELDWVRTRFRGDARTSRHGRRGGRGGDGGGGGAARARRAVGSPESIDGSAHKGARSRDDGAP